MANDKRTKVNLFCTVSGIVYFLIGMMQQYLVNSLKKTAAVGLIMSLAFAFIVILKSETRIGSKQGKSGILAISIVFFLVAAMNLIGCFADTFAMVSILGIVSFVMGIVLTAAGLASLFKNGRSVALKIVISILAVIAFVGCGFFTLTTISPATTTSLFGSMIMGSTSSNVWEAKQTESVLEDGTRLISDIRYDDEIPNGYLDIYYTNKNKFAKAPTFIFIHGGGYVWGDKVIGDPNMAKEGPTDLITTNFLAQGYNVVQMNYALAPEYQFPSSIKQLNRGLRFLVENGSEFNLDMTNIVLGGGSAGGNLAGLLVNIQTNPEYAKTVDEKQAINPEYIKAVYFLAALYDNYRFGVTGKDHVDWMFTQLGRLYLGTDEIKTAPSIRETNVIEYVTDAFPASFISDGNTGTFYDQAFDMYNKLRNLGVDSEICYFPPQEAILTHGHEGNDSEYSRMMYQRLFEFLSRFVR